ncbi:MAG: ABC transporter permease [Lachnospiraceae bacterium]|nr:ABC transporter permease [Lachnospiraceae bacterium]
MSQARENKSKKAPGLIKTVVSNRTIIFKLAKNDFKNRFAGSYLGVFWAFVQPVITVLMYYIVFDKIFQSRSEAMAGEIPIPYVLFLTAGLVPWFFFNEGMINGMTSLIQYNYLVKKVVFNIDILPVIKVLSAGFVHLFFVLVLLIMGAVYGYYPSVYTLQIPYYSFCLFALILACSYATSAIVVFFKDLQQILQIVLQLGMWATPVLWNIGKLSPRVQFFLKINPLCYVVNGYRLAICDRKWFFEDWGYTLYFWGFTLAVTWIGRVIFRKLRVYFADVL